MMASELDYWPRTLGESYAPTMAFELTNGLLGLAWWVREKEIGGTAYTEFILATVVEPGGRIQHFTTYSVPKTLVKRVENYRWRRDSALADLFSKIKKSLFKGEDGDGVRG